MGRGSLKNAHAVVAALREFGAPLTNIAPADFAKEGSIYQMGRPPARVDVLTSIEGVRFADAWPNRMASNFDGIPAPVISLQDLLTNKRTVGRPQDLVDVSNLLEAERALEKPKNETKPEKRKPKGKDRGIER
jgi:hypothetical protein